MNKVTIYTLSCPITLEVKYVGQTIYSLNRRMKEHLCQSPNKAMRAWIISLGEPPIIEEIDTCSFADRNDFEEYWIMQFRAWGFNLFNSKKYVRHLTVQEKFDAICRK